MKHISGLKVNGNICIVDFYLSKRRNTKTSKLFLQKLIKHNKSYCPSVINTNKIPIYNQAIHELNQEGPA